MRDTSAAPARIELRDVKKAFGDKPVLTGVSLKVMRGESLVIIGGSGSGKSVTLKCILGILKPDAGAIEFEGETIAVSSPHDAQRLGIVTIYQELALAPNMTIAENVFIGREPGPRLFVSWRRMAAETRAITERIGLSVNPMALVKDLSVAEQQMVEIARALSMRSRLIVMDEPTSALSASEVQKLFDAAHAFPGFSLVVDLERQTVSTPDGALAFAFEVEPFRKHCLLNGLDDIGLTLQHADQIRAFEAKRLADEPWLA